MLMTFTLCGRVDEPVHCGAEEDPWAGVKRLVHKIQRSTHYWTERCETDVLYQMYTLLWILTYV